MQKGSRKGALFVCLPDCCGGAARICDNGRKAKMVRLIQSKTFDSRYDGKVEDG
jgi:hypothetical protein